MRISVCKMAVSLHDASAQIISRAGTFLEHFLKIQLFPSDINQNKWRTELATRVKECARYKNTATNRKFRPEIYRALFTTLQLFGRFYNKLKTPRLVRGGCSLRVQY